MNASDLWGLISGRSALESENTGYPSTGLNNVGQPCRRPAAGFSNPTLQPICQEAREFADA
jgi:hypothetical protein